MGSFLGYFHGRKKIFTDGNPKIYKNFQKEKKSINTNSSTTTKIAISNVTSLNIKEIARNTTAIENMKKDETEDDNDDPNLEDDDSETEDEEQTDDDEEEEVVSTVDTAATVFQDLDHLTEEQWDWVSENWVSRTQSPQ